MIPFQNLSRRNERDKTDPAESKAGTFPDAIAEELADLIAVVGEGGRLMSLRSPRRICFKLSRLRWWLRFYSGSV